eukprot:scaffold69697_cov54-Phaeocystis_antarctica.AAC.4
MYGGHAECRVAGLLAEQGRPTRRVGQAVAALEGVCGHLWAILGTGSEVEVQRCEAPASVVSGEFALLRCPAAASALPGGG